MKTPSDLRALDRQVAAALGWTELQPHAPRGILFRGPAVIPQWHGVPPGKTELERVPEWSTSIADAWPLAERFGLTVGPSKFLGGYLASDGWDLAGEWKHGLTACLAICAAVLALAVPTETR